MSEAGEATALPSKDGDDKDSERKPFWKQPRNWIGSFLGLLLIVAAVAGLRLGIADARKADLEVDCETQKFRDLEDSREHLLSTLNSEATRLRQAGVLVGRDLTEAEETEQLVLLRMEAAIASFEEERQAVSAARSTLERAKEVEDKDVRKRRVARAREELRAAAGPREAAAQEVSDAEAALNEASLEVVRLREEFELLARQEMRKTVVYRRIQLVNVRDLDETKQLTWTRADLVLQPDVPTGEIHLGSSRKSKRVEIAFTIRTEPETRTVATDADGVTRQVFVSALPETFWFDADTDQLRRGQGPEIPDEQVWTWATRYGENVIVSVCVNPDERLDAGRYSGSVRIVDPTVSAVSVPVDVTAQSSLINWMLLTLVFSPLFAFLFVWAKLRHTSGEVAWEQKAFWNWFGQNFIISYVIGFGAVWATLQVPFADETFGESFIRSAAAVGVTLVAAVGAITPVVGKVRGEGIDPEPTNTKAEALRRSQRAAAAAIET